MAWGAWSGSPPPGCGIPMQSGIPMRRSLGGWRSSFVGGTNICRKTTEGGLPVFTMHVTQATVTANVDFQALPASTLVMRSEKYNYDCDDNFDPGA